MDLELLWTNPKQTYASTDDINITSKIETGIKLDTTKYKAFFVEARLHSNSSISSGTVERRIGQLAEDRYGYPILSYDSATSVFFIPRNAGGWESRMARVNSDLTVYFDKDGGTSENVTSTALRYQAIPLKIYGLPK